MQLVGEGSEERGGGAAFFGGILDCAHEGLEEFDGLALVEVGDVVAVEGDVGGDVGFGGPEEEGEGGGSKYGVLRTEC